MGPLAGGWEHAAQPTRGAALLEAAGRLARDGGTVTGLLAVRLVTGAAGTLGRPDESRSLLRMLRRHPDPDVRHQAHQAVTETE